MNPSAIFSKTGKGVQEASGKTSNLSRADRAVLAAIDGKSTLGEVQEKFEKIPEGKFAVLIVQLDKDGYIREVSTTQPAVAAPAKPAAAKPAAADKPAQPAPPAAGDELDFTQAIKVPPKPQVDLAAAARAEAQRLANEQQMLDIRKRQDAEARAHAQAEASLRGAAETDAKVNAAREAALRATVEAKAKLEAEAKAKTEAAERERRVAEERARKEAEEKAQLAAKLEQERKARVDAERRAREAEERTKREAEDKAKREAEEKAKREAEEKAKREAAEKAKREAEEKAKREAEEKAKREVEERRRREEAESKRRAEEDRRRKEQEAQRAKEDAERKARDEQERKRRDDEDRRRKEEDERRAKDEAERKSRQERESKDREQAEAKAAESAPAIADELLGDLAAFSAREEEERKAREEQERQSREHARARAKEAERTRQREEQEAQRRRDEQRRQKEQQEQRAREEEARRAHELEEEEQRLAVERKRKARELIAAKEAEQRRQGPGEDEVVVGPEEIDMDDVERDQQALAKKKEARPAAREHDREKERDREKEERAREKEERTREKEERTRAKEERARAKEREREDEEESRASEQPATAKRRSKPINWGKLAGISLVVALVGGLGVLHLMPLSTTEYERAASQALGVPVKIASGRMSLLTGPQVHLERISIGQALRIAQLRGSTDFGSLFGEQKKFSRVELEGVTLQQGQLANVLLGKVRGANLRIERIALKQAKLDGPVALPAIDAEAMLADDGSIRSVKASGADRFSLELTPKGGEIVFEVSAGSFAVPFVPGFNLVEFGAKGSATRQGMTVSEFDGRAYEGVISGTARVRWGAEWSVEGDLRIRGVNVAVFAPALVSEGKAEGRGTYSMSGPEMTKLGPGARLEGNLKIERGVLGSFDLARAIQTSGTQVAGRTLFAELNAQGLYDMGTVQLRNVTIAAGALNAGASLDIGADGALAGRVVADVKTATQTLRATVNISGRLQEPVVRR